MRAVYTIWYYLHTDVLFRVHAQPVLGLFTRIRKALYMH